MFGGTYWPGPSATTGKGDQLGFLEVLEKIKKVWTGQHDRCIASASEILQQLKEFSDEGLKGTGGEPGEGLELDLLEEAYQHFMARYDPLYGGFGSRLSLLPHRSVCSVLTDSVGRYPQVPHSCQSRLFVTVRDVPGDCPRYRWRNGM